MQQLRQTVHMNIVCFWYNNLFSSYKGYLFFLSDDDDDDADRRKKRSSSEYYDGSYTDRKGYLVKWKWYNSRKYYWFYDNYNVKKTFYIRDSKRCYYYYKDNELYQYYLENDKRHYYGTRDSSYSGIVNLQMKNHIMLGAHFHCLFLYTFVFLHTGT